MKLNTLLRRFPFYYEARKCLYIKAGPGVGKTTTILRAPEIISKHTGHTMGMVIINGPLLTPQDSIGYLVPKHFPDGRVESLYTDPFWFRTAEGKRLDEYDGGIIFVDEADKMDTDCKKIIGEAALSGRLGPHRLPDGWVIWMAGNRSADRSGSTKELDHLINRRCEIDISPDLDSWTEWASNNGVMPLTIAFANQHPQIVFNDAVPEKQGPWCTPRSLVDTDHYMQIVAGDSGVIPDDDDSMEETSGMIGQAAAAQLYSFVRLEREMPKFERIVAEPTKARVPDKPDAQMLVCYNLAHRVDVKTVDAVITYVSRLGKEFAVTFAKAACNRDWKLVNTPAFHAWSKENASLMAAIGRVQH